MKCNNCGYESQSDFAFCPQCGSAQNAAPQAEPVASAPAPEVTPVPEAAPAPEAAAAPTPEASPAPAAAPKYYNGGAQQNTASASGAMAEYILKTLKDSLFLVICILYSAGTAFALFSGSVDVIGILITIFLWLTFAKAQKGITSKEHLRCISGTVFASYVVNYVLAGSMAFLGLIVMIFGTSSSGLMSSLLQTIYREAGIGYNSFMGGFISTAVMILGVVLIICAAGVAVINYFATRSIHRFVQSVYTSIGEEKAYLAKVNAAKTWLMVLGIIGGVGAVFSLFSGEFISFIASGSGAAAEIIASIMIKKYYSAAVSGS